MTWLSGFVTLHRPIDIHRIQYYVQHTDNCAKHILIPTLHTLNFSAILVIVKYFKVSVSVLKYCFNNMPPSVCVPGSVVIE